VQEADERYRGGPDHPFTREELHEKFTDCASLVLSELGMTDVISKVESIEHVSDVTALVRALGGAAAARAGAAAVETR
jgi:hypothetical protein